MTDRSASQPAGRPSRLARARRIGTPAWQIVVKTLGACVRYRVTGLAAEAAFFAILSLPPLIFGLAGAIGFVARRFDVRTIEGFREQVLHLSSRALTADAVDNVIQPTLDDVLSGPRFEIISIGFLIALWAGSRSLNVFVDTITIMYGLAGERGLVKTRALSFALYLIFLLVGIVLLPLVLVGPSVVERVVPARLYFVGDLYWPVVLLVSVLLPGHPLPRLDSGAHPLAGRSARRRPDHADVDRWQRPAARRAQSVRRQHDDLRTARGTDRGADLALHQLAGRTRRRRVQRRVRRGVASALRHRPHASVSITGHDSQHLENQI